MNASHRERDPSEAKPVRPDPLESELEEELTGAMLEHAPEGRGPSKKVVRSELHLVIIAAIVAVVALLAITLATAPSYSTVLTIALLGLGYAAVSPVLIAFLLRRRDEAEAHERAHEIVEETMHRRGRIRRRAFYWSDSST